MTLTNFSRFTAFGLYFLSFGFLSAASSDSDATQEHTRSSSQRAVLVPYETAFLIPYDDQEVKPAQRTVVIPMEASKQEEDPLVLELMRQQEAAGEKVRKADVIASAQACKIEEMKARSKPPVPQTSASSPVPCSVSDIVIPEVANGYEEIYRRFIGGKLIYKPDPKSDTGMIELPISALTNPLEGTFDLSGCGDTEKYLSISTGYRKAQKAENTNKLEIWITPRFLVDRELNSTAHHLQPIMDSWNADKAATGVFWTWGGWSGLENYYYLVTNSLGDFGSEDLYRLQSHSESRPDMPVCVYTPGGKGGRHGRVAHAHPVCNHNGEASQRNARSMLFMFHF